VVARTSYESEDYRNLDAKITIVLYWHGLCKFHSYQRLPLCLIHNRRRRTGIIKLIKLYRKIHTTVYIMNVFVHSNEILLIDDLIELQILLSLCTKP
jgi:hypothetical protein